MAGLSFQVKQRMVGQASQLDLAWQTDGSGDGEVVVEQCSDRFWEW